MTTATDSTPTMSATDPRFVFAQAVATAGSTIAAVQRAQLTDPTPCTDYDVRTLMGHLLTVLGRVAVLAEGGDPLAMPIVTTGTPDDAWPAAWTAAAHRVMAAWTDDETLDRMMVLPWAQVPGRAMLGVYTSELTVHTWDLASATGQQVAWDEQVLQTSLAASRSALPGGDREAGFAAMAAKLPPHMAGNTRPFGNPIDPAHDALLIDQLVAWYGRNP